MPSAPSQYFGPHTRFIEWGAGWGFGVEVRNMTKNPKQAKPARSPDHPDVDEGYILTPPRKQSGPQQLAPGYLWNSTTQELIPILPEDHPDHQENTEILRAAVRRWENGKQK
jgi:hypothetical protein